MNGSGEEWDELAQLRHLIVEPRLVGLKLSLEDSLTIEA